jgi:serine protease Do
MRTLRSQTHWVLALICGFGMVAIAVSTAEKTTATLPPPVAARDMHDLSTAFRNVAQTALPGVVTIRTTSRVSGRRSGSEAMPEGFEEFFKGDPRFREFFRGMPQQPQERRQEGMGSGFIVDESGIIATNNHVVADTDEIIVKLHDGREFRGTGVKADPRTDIAIFKIDTGAPLPKLRFGDSDQTQVGDWVVAVGNPFGHELTVTSGIVSAKGRGPGIAEREDFIQTDAAINPGNSGGPLLNLNGDVIGVNTAISSRSGGFDGIGFAVPSRMAWWVVKQLIEKGAVDRAYIGISIQEINNDLAQQLDLRVGEGAIVNQVMADSPGEQAKLKIGDVIQSLAGQAVTGPRSLQGIVEQLEIGKEYKVEIVRDGERQSLPIVLMKMPDDYTLARTGRIRRPDREKKEESVAVEKYGFEVKEATEEIAEQLSIEAGVGVVVSSVDANGPAARGLSVGDVILKVGRGEVNSVDDFNMALSKSDPVKGLYLLVKSGDVTRFVAIRPAT